MKKIFFFLCIAMFALSIKAQDYTGLDKAKASSDEDIQDPQKAGQAKVWMNRGEVYLKIALDPTGFYKKLDNNATAKADEALAKAYELDKNDPKKPGKLAPKLAKLLTSTNPNAITLRQALLVDGAKKFDLKDYKGAFSSFKRATEIGELPIVNSPDTSAYYNAGIAALNAEDYNESVKFFKKAIELKYGGGNAFSLMAKAMAMTADSVNVVATLEDGIKMYPDDNQSLMESLIDFYVKKGQANEAISYLDKVIVKNPSQPVYYFVKGALLDNQGKIDEAKALYEKAIELKPDYYMAYYNIGVMYYNKSREYYKQADKIPPTSAENQKKFDELVKQGDAQLLISKEYLEKVLQYEKEDLNTLDALKSVYMKLKMTDKYNEVKAIIDSKKE
jgi:tetratricopeptide (TPR) repeat protein